MYSVYTVIVLCTLGLIGAKAELYIYFEELIIVAIDPEYFDPEKTDAFVTDDNKIASNYSIVKKFPLETDIHFKLLGLSMGEYMVSTGLDTTQKFCNVIRDPIIYGPMFTEMGMSPDFCPPEPGNYIHEGFAAPMENLPDNFIENKYLLIFEIKYDGKPLFATNTYLEVQNE